MLRGIRCGLFAFGVSLMYIPGASAQQITTEFDHAADFSKFRTFAIRDGQIRSPSPVLNSELTKKHLEEAIERALTSKGLKKANGPSDLNVVYTFGSLRMTETGTVPAGRRGLGRAVVTTPNTEGTLVIDLRDPTTRSLVWHGVATEKEPNPAKLAEKIDDMVKKVVAKYPPKK